MSNTDEPGTILERVGPTPPFPVVLGSILVASYSIAQGSAVLRELVVRVGDPTTRPGFGGATPAGGPAITSFSTLAGDFLTGAPAFALLVVGLAGFAVYQGRSLRDGTLLSLSLTLGVFVGVTTISETAGFWVLFLVVSALLLGVLFGGVGSLLGVGARRVVRYTSGTGPR